MDAGELLYQQETYAIRGAVFEVSRELGTGFLESVYQECLAAEFRRAGIGYVEHQPLPLLYKGERLETVYKPDFICFGKIIVELKVAEATAEEHWNQSVNYRKMTRLRLGLLVNCGSYPKASIARIAF